ncbi:threonine-phosphate decarboxylase [Anaerobacillus alkalilacustris]|uniref:threonine-phosphate decarboxylase n=1 Tax=Anaerobacillus alkalilacustris TaxID=393763 RepID=A0A1S2LMM6_9BACI|nr:threonine-phosphate decarboxylase CobD [Anaerobacillus alkalilacustris]OIJ13616.1 threonine-phosphate decarboxylase [Anaerobacillus alkalilacustris]
MKWPSHGGQPQAMKKLCNIENDKKILDFSANLNPLGPPTWLKEEIIQNLDSLTCYPDPSYSRSSCCIAGYEGVSNGQILLTNGGAEAIFLAAKLFEGRKAIIVQPTFIEYERACIHYQIVTEDVFLDEKSDFQLPLQQIFEKMKEVDVIFLCRPNNPTGTVVDEESLKQLLNEGRNTGTYIVVDEAFVDFLPFSIPSLTRWLASYSNLILLRSLTKMYTIPGLRLGYVLATKEVIEKMREAQMPWSINAFADAVVPRLLEDRTFIEKTHHWLKLQSTYLFDKLTDLDFYCSTSKVNFFLLRDNLNPNRTDQLFHYLFRHGILTRHTHNFKRLEGEYLRIAIRSEEENKQLLFYLQKWRNEQ